MNQNCDDTNHIGTNELQDALQRFGSYVQNFKIREMTTQLKNDGKISSAGISKVVFLEVCIYIFMNYVCSAYRKKVHFGRTMHCLPQRLKSTFFEIFSSLRVSFGDPPFEIFSKIVDFSL